jgi:YjbE family integral membrane protein
MSLGAGEWAFWIGLMQIIGIDLLLSGDNAIVLALASRSVPPEQRRLVTALGAGLAVALRLVLALAIFELLRVPYLRLAGGVLLLWIAMRLGRERPQPHTEARPNARLWAAIRTILIADALMSLDNVVAIVGAARDNVVLLALGLAISMPLVIYGSRLMLRLIGRYPFAITLGAGLIGWVAGDMIAADPGLHAWIGAHWRALDYLLPILGIALATAPAWRRLLMRT